ncbi:hypothetical protein STEG23_016556 [Scotinomys teguina]
MVGEGCWLSLVATVGYLLWLDPLNSGDDVSEQDVPDLFDTDNVIVCQYDKSISVGVEDVQTVPCRAQTSQNTGFLTLTDTLVLSKFYGGTSKFRANSNR